MCTTLEIQTVKVKGEKKKMRYFLAEFSRSVWWPSRWMEDIGSTESVSNHRFFYSLASL